VRACPIQPQANIDGGNIRGYTPVSEWIPASRNGARQFATAVIALFAAPASARTLRRTGGMTTECEEMKVLLLVVAALAVAGSACAGISDWYWAWDGTSVFDCCPSQDGQACYWLRYTDTPTPNCFWEIVDNGSGGKAMRVYDMDTNLMLRWQGAGTRPEHYRGPCDAYAMDNFHPDYKAFTLAMRFRVDEFLYNSGGETCRRFLNFEFETTTPKPSPTTNHTTYQFRFEGAAVYRDNINSSGNLWLRDYRTNETFCMIKPAGGPARWIKMWAVGTLPNPPYVNNNAIYRMWIDTTGDPVSDNYVEYTWSDRDKGGWSDVELGSLGDSHRGDMLIDYICYSMGAHYPGGGLAVPSEKSPETPLKPIDGFDKNKLGHVKLQPAGYPVDVSGLVVTGVFTHKNYGTPVYFVQDPDSGDIGVKVNYFTGKPAVDTAGDAVAIQVGDRVAVNGGICLADCEKQIAAHKVVRLGSGAVDGPMLVSNKTIVDSHKTSLRATDPDQALKTSVVGTVSSNPTQYIRSGYDKYESSFTDTTKSWAVDQWRHKTVYFPYNNLYYWVRTNTSNTIVCSHRAGPGLKDCRMYTDGVRKDDPYVFVGDDTDAPRVDGMFVTVFGKVTYVDATNKILYIDDGAGNAQSFTLQDQVDKAAIPLWNPPTGIRVSLWGTSVTMPEVGKTVSVTGCTGNYKYIYSEFDASLNRDEIRIAKAMPIVWGQTLVVRN